MARSVATASEVGFFGRHWLGLLGAVVAANALVVGAILFEPGPARAQPVAAAESEEDPAPVGVANPRVAVGAETPGPAQAVAERPLDLRLPGYLPPLKGMPQAPVLPIGPDGQPMSPEVAEGFAMVEQFRTTLDRLLGEFERAGRTSAAAEAFNLAFAAEAAQMSQRAAKLDVTKLPDRDQTRLRDHAEKVLMPLIRRMQAAILESTSEAGQQDVEVAPQDSDDPVDLEEEPVAPSEANPANEFNPDDPDQPDPLTRAILE